MVEVVRSSTFDAWLRGLRDRVGRAKILVRIERLAAGNPGDVRPVGEGISELRVSFGPGYRIYFMHEGESLVVLLAGGDKSSQPEDITRAKAIAKQWSAST
ncbi:MAG: type II toxin-antitoxin system RelE/ParE family toxin [Gemmatimonadaceae bacterium]|nr:type II toxin-antitoxin system RelE/ParE family toxin [Acetobacteraceae bacterium]